MYIKKAYDRLPRLLQPFARRGYYKCHPHHKSDGQIHNERHEFINYYFDSHNKFKDIKAELDQGKVATTLDEVKSKAKERDPSLNPYFEDYYALIRKIQPNTVVETGVAGGVSTTFALLALNKNSSPGTLHSIEFSKSEYHTGNTEPSEAGKPDIGYLVPDSLIEDWELILGKSQRELPQLVLSLDEIDLFLHDSEHSISCMSFEFELMWEWLNETGVIISDDVAENIAFDKFVSKREPTISGRINRSLGYIGK
jgi:predicted O-methyltransferase YrrM